MCLQTSTQSAKFQQDSVPTTSTNKLQQVSSVLPLEDDPRPLVSDLLKEHAKVIAKVREAIQTDPLYDASRYDDIWILRYVLSHKKSKPAIAAALKTMKHRHERKLNDLGDVRHKVFNHSVGMEGNVDAFDIHKKFNSYWLEGQCGVMQCLPDPDRGAVTILYPAAIDIPGLNAGMTPEELAEAYEMVDECLYQINDEITRRTGRLTKLLRIMDMKDMSIRNMDTTFMKRDAAAAKANEDYYPQLLGTAIFVNAPGWFTTMWAVLRNFFPKRVVAKLDFVDIKKAEKRFRPYISAENLPERYGGKNPVWPLPFAGERFLQQKKKADTGITTDC